MRGMAQRSLSKTATLNNLRARWAVLLFVGFIAIGISHWLLRLEPLTSSTYWLVMASLAFLWQIIVFYFDLSKNTPVNQRYLLPGFGIGTLLSLFRLLTLSLLAGFLFSPRPAGWLAWAPFTLYLLFNLVDLVDGYAARRWGQVTRLGAKLDLDLDTRGMLVGGYLAVQYGTAGWWYLLVGLARYLFVAGVWLRQRLELPVIEKPNPLSRPLAGLQMGVSTALLAPALHPPYTILISTLVMVPFLGNFLYDWLVIGRKRSSSQLILPAWISQSLPLFVRGLVAAILVTRIVSGEVIGISLYVEVFLAIGLVLGGGVRVLSLVLLVHLGLSLRGERPGVIDLVLSISSLTLVYLGAGYFSLWSPENSIIRRRLGDRSAK